VNTDRIERRIALPTTRAHVEGLGAWFGAAFDGASAAAARLAARIVSTTVDPGVAKLRAPHAGKPFLWSIDAVEPLRRISFRRHPFPVEPDVDDSQEPATRIVVGLHDADVGTLLTVVESGFDRIPLSRRSAAFRANDGGWPCRRTRPTSTWPRGRAYEWCATRHSQAARAGVRTPRVRATHRDIADAAPVFAALGDRTRPRVASRLCRSGPSSNARLTADTDLSRQVVAQQLRALERAGLPSSGRTGRERVSALHARRRAETRLSPRRDLRPVGRPARASAGGGGRRGAVPRASARSRRGRARAAQPAGRHPRPID
jgi:DNA-binding transcriptional ArsR family regulator